MPKPELQEQTTHHQEEKEPSLKGTLVSVVILGLFLIVSWFGVWSLYMVR